MELPGMTSATVAVTLAAAMTISNLGSFAAPVLVGYLADRTGSYLPGFAFWSLMSFSLVIAALLLPETGPRARPTESSK